MKSILLMLLLPLAATAAESGKDGSAAAKELIRRIETQYLGKTSYAETHMMVRTEFWTRNIHMKMWGEGREKFLVRITAPKKEKGTATLKIGDELWNYLPKIDRLIKIPSSLMGDSWMGSHFTNDDLVKEYKIDELYDLKYRKRGGDRAVITGVPKPDAAVVWGRIEYHVDLKKLVAERIEYYDEDGELVRTFVFDEVRQTSGRWVPMRMTVRPVDHPDEVTVMTYVRLDLDVGLKKGIFSLRSLRRR